MSYNKSNNPLSSVYMTQMAVIKKYKRKKVQGAKCMCMTGVNCCVIGNVLNGI